MDDLNELPLAQLWAMLDGVDGVDRAEVLEAISSRLYQQEDWQQALSLCEAAAQCYLENGADRPAAYALFNQAQCLLQMLRTDEAVKTYDRAADILRTAGDESDIGECLNRSGHALVRAGRDEEAIPRFASAQRLFAANGQHERAGRDAIARGEALGRLGILPDALESFREARELFRGQVSPYLVAWADDRAAAALIDLGRVKEAIDLLRGCLHVAQVGGDEREHAYAAYRLGWTLCTDGHYDEALTHLQVARDLYSAQQDLGGSARCDEQAANALSHIGEEGQAESLYVRARSVFDALGEDAAAHQCDVNRAVLYTAAGRLEEAISLNRRVLASLGAGDAWMRQGVVSRMAMDLVAAGRPEEALALLDAHPSQPEGDEVLERGRWMAARASALVAVGRSGEAREVADAGLQLAAHSDYALLRANLYEARGLAREALGDSDFLRDLAYAVALFLADGSASRARDLSQKFLPEAPAPDASRLDSVLQRPSSAEPPQPEVGRFADFP